jgi:aminoglycoside 6'-N-acetyltransferase
VAACAHSGPAPDRRGVRGATLTFRPLRRADFPLLARWLADPVVARWWDHETSPQALERDFGPSVDGRDPAEMFIASVDGREFGFIQRYALADEPEYRAELSAICALDPAAISVDYLIGEPDMRGRGLGAAMIAACVAGAVEVVVPVVAGNVASWRALERAGFERVAEADLEPDNPIDPPLHYVYRQRGSSETGAPP